MKRFLFSSDLHGNLYQFEELVKAAIQYNVNDIIIGGDLSYKSKSMYFNRPTHEEFELVPRSPSARVVFFEEFVFPILQEFLDINTENRIFLAHGNADYHANCEFLRHYHPQIICSESEVIFPDEKEEDEYFEYLLIYSRTALSPHKVKDNERFEWMSDEKLEEFEKIPQFLSGIVSFCEDEIEEYQMVIVEDLLEKYDPPMTPICLTKTPEFSIEYEFQKLIDEVVERLEESEKPSIWICHSPPFGANDVIRNNERLSSLVGQSDEEFLHIGSRCIRKYVEEVQPSIVLSGHVHESYGLTNGEYSVMVGGSECLCSANSPIHEVFRGVLFEVGEDGEFDSRLIERDYSCRINT